MSINNATKFDSLRWLAEVEVVSNNPKLIYGRLCFAGVLQ